jgi:hypothetical protein
MAQQFSKLNDQCKNTIFICVFPHCFSFLIKHLAIHNCEKVLMNIGISSDELKMKEALG